MDEIRIGRRSIGAGHPCFVIAEAGVNHNGDLGTALQLVEAAAAAGADAVKFQTFTARDLATEHAPKADYQKAEGETESQLEMLARLELDETAHEELKERADSMGLHLLSSVFSEEAVDQLQRLGVEALKIPSGELTNHPLLARAARSGLPLIVSTGMASLEETREAVATIEDAGDPPFVLLHCVSTYPTDASDANLLAMETLRTEFVRPVGFSDHTLGTAVALAAVALGAAVLEKHLTLDTSSAGPDHAMSLDPDSFGDLVRGVRQVEASLGDGIKKPRPSEAPIAAVTRRSLVAARDLEAGTTLAGSDLVPRRAGAGIPPTRLDEFVGRVLLVPARRGDPLHPEMFD